MIRSQTMICNFHPALLFYIILVNLFLTSSCDSHSMFEITDISPDTCKKKDTLVIMTMCLLCMCFVENLKKMISIKTCEITGLGSLQATYSTSYPLPDLFPLSFIPAVDFSWPISLKLNTFTLIKIVLKIIVFKMIVKFIATICLLLFLPKLFQESKPDRPSNDDDEDESRKFDDKRELKTFIFTLFY